MSSVVSIETRRARSEPPFEAWAKQISEGDHASEACIAGTILPGAHRILLLHGAGDHAQDLANDAVVLVIEKLRSGSIKTPASIAAFTRTTALRLLANHRRKDKRRDHITQRYNLGTEDRAIVPSTYESAAHSELLSIVREALKNLRPPSWRDVLWRRYVRGQDPEYIAKELGIQVSAVWVLLSRARARLKTMLEGRVNAFAVAMIGAINMPGIFL